MTMTSKLDLGIDRRNWLRLMDDSEQVKPNHAENSIFSGDRTGDMPILNQGRTNGCGTTSLAMIMTFFGHERSPADIDEEIRRQDIFSSPNDLVEYARDAGLNAEMYNQGTPEELAHLVDQGIPTQILTTADGSGDPEKMHYVVITGYEVAKDGSLSFHVHNPWGIEETWTAEELEQRWGNTPFGFDHFYIAVGPKDAALPPSRTDGVEGTLNAADGIVSVLGGYDRVVNARSAGEFLRGVSDVGLGIPQALIGGVLGGLQLGAEYLENEVRDVPIIGAPLAAGLDHFEERLGTVNMAVTAMSNSVSHLNASVEHFADGEVLAGASDLLQSQVDLVEGAWAVSVDIVKDTVSGVKDLGTSLVDVASDVVTTVETAVGNAVDSFGEWTGWW